MSDFFVNDKYRVLDCMAQRQIAVGDASVVKLSQQEMADILGFTKSKVNAVIRELKEYGYITQINVRGKYALTDKANAEIQKMQNKEAVI